VCLKKRKGVVGPEVPADFGDDFLITHVVGASLVYNTRPYDVRGWCVFEQGLGRIATAHLEKASKQLAKAKKMLPPPYANLGREKIIDMSADVGGTGVGNGGDADDDGGFDRSGGGGCCPGSNASKRLVSGEVDPKDLMDELLSKIEDEDLIKFTGKADRETVMMMLNDFEWSIMQATYAAEVSGSGVAPRDRVRAKVWPTAEAALALARQQAGDGEDAPVSDARRRRGSRTKSVGFESTLQTRVAAAARLQARTRTTLGLPPPVKVETFEEGEEELVVEELVEEEAVETAAAEEEEN
jgi:hypothetical protein